VKVHESITIKCFGLQEPKGIHFCLLVKRNKEEFPEEGGNQKRSEKAYFRPCLFSFLETLK
jgi:hypothetical protein